MTPELTWLTLSAVLAASLWIPYIVGVNTMEPAAEPAPSPFYRPPDLSEMPAWVHRAHRAHLNMIETLVPFAAVVLVAHIAGVTTGATVAAAVVFFWLRLAHAVGMISGWARMPMRPLLFTASWACTLVVAGAVLTA
ncbi:MAG: MAPEG family protein [Pseudomonadota bacterium]